MKKLFTIGLLLCQLMATAQSNDYDPILPSHPGQNGWDSTTGALVVTWFTPGQLSSAVEKATNDEKGYSHIEKIRSLTVSGKANNNDMKNLRDLKRYLRVLDLSRTDGITEVGQYIFSQDTVMHTLLLPASIEEIGSYAFEGSTQLASVTCYATTPPVLGNDRGHLPFDGCSQALTVYVPAESLPLYAKADGWKDLQLMPITQGVHSLTVTLPATATGLKDLFLELANVKTGQSQRLVLTSRTQYTFPNLIEGTLYNIYIRSARDNTLAAIEGVEIAKENVQVGFADLKSLRDLTIQLLAPDGTALPAPQGEGAGVGSVTWTDLAGNFLSKGATLTAQVEGSKAIAKIRLGEQLGTQYQQPADTTIVVGNTGTVYIRLTPLAQTELTGTVTAAATGQPIRSANIAVTQQLNGLYPVTLTATTDKDGHWTLSAYEAPTEITAQASGYIPQHSALAGFAGETQDFSLADLTGTTVLLDLNYRPAVRSGETPDANADYNSYQSLIYTVYDETHQQELANIQQQGGRLVLQDQQLAEGTRLRLTAISPQGDIAPAPATCTVGADGRTTATLQLVQLGQLKATFSQTENQAVVGMLYDSNGQLLSSSRYSTPSATAENEKPMPTIWFIGLSDGQYTLVTMGESQLFNGINTLDGLTEMYLEEGRDYVSNAVTIQAGRIDSLHNQAVPMMDETVFYYTTGQTHFTANKTALTVGNYVTLRAQVDFKAGVNPTDLCLLFDLPEGYQLVEGSVMAGNQLAQYEVEGQRVIVPVNCAADIVRFCVVPTREGYYEPTASIAFSSPYGGDRGGLQPLGSVGFTAEALSISAQERVSNGRVMVSGTAIAGSDVQIYEGDQLIGHTEAGPEGSWSMRCSLVRPYNLSQHYVYAVITTPDGLTLQTDAETVTVSHGTVTPVVYASNSVTTGVIKWDFRDFSVTPKHNAWPLGPGTLPFTFKVDFYNEDNVMVNDTALISNVVLYVLRSDDRYVKLNAPYNKASNKWIAQCDFDIDASPKNICVDFLQKETIMTDRQEMDDYRDDVLQTISEDQQMVKEVYDLLNEEIVLEDQPLYDELDRLFAIENPDEATQTRIKELLELLMTDADPTQTPTLTLDEIRENLNSLDAAKLQWRDKTLQMLSYLTSTDTITISLEEKENQYDIPMANGVIHFTSKKESSINEQTLLSEGYTPALMTDGTSIYYLNTGVMEAYLDTRSQMHYILEWEEGAKARQNNRRQDIFRIGALVVDSIFDQAEVEHIKSIGSQLYDIGYAQQSSFSMSQLLLNSGKALSKEMYLSADKLYKDGLAKMKQQVSEMYEQIIDSCIAGWNKANNLYYDAKAERNEAAADGKAWDYVKYSLAEVEQAQKTISECNVLMQQAKKDKEKFDKLEKKTEKDYRKLMGILNRYPISLVYSNLGNNWVTGANGATDRARDFEDSPIGLLSALQLCYYYAKSTYEDLEEWQKTYQAIRNKIPCEGNEDEAIQLMTETVDAIIANGKEETKEEFHHAAKFYYANGWSNGYHDGSGFVHTDSLSLSWFYTSWNKYHNYSDNMLSSDFWMNSVMMTFYNFDREIKQFNKSKSQRKSLDARINALKCKKPDPDPVEEEDETETSVFEPGKPSSPNGGGGGFRIRWSPFFGIDFYHDPSGYVYEAVSSNRLEGVRATCYYKETGEDMYGDMYEREVVWNAEEYAQENPLFTDSEGKYRWDVPQGLWQVRYEKDGYEPKRSEWLPVPPPQLEVNVGMTQLRQPSVQKVKAYTDGIEITFDKYMRPTTLSTENIFVTRGGQTIGGTIELLNADSGYETPDSVYASKFRFNVNDNLNVNDKLLLTVKKTVESYAGLQMEQDFQQEFDVEPRITAIVTDTLLYMAEGAERTVTVSILPAEAARGKQLKAVSLDESVVTVSPSLGEGLGWVLTAKTLGSSAVRFSLTDDDELTATTTVHVRDSASMYVYTPRASRMSGTEVYRGAEIKLTSQTAGATILYTLDGSCPCDGGPSVLTYRGPIAATGTELHIKAMAVANGMAESEVAEFRYKVIDNPVGIKPIDNSQSEIDNFRTYYRLDGRRTAKPQKGLNIVRQGDGTVQKILVK